MNHFFVQLFLPGFIFLSTLGVATNAMADASGPARVAVIPLHDGSAMGAQAAAIAGRVSGGLSEAGLTVVEERPPRDHAEDRRNLERASARVKKAHALSGQGEFERAILEYQAAVTSMRESLEAQTDGAIAETLIDLGTTYKYLGELDRAMESFQEARVLGGPIELDPGQFDSEVMAVYRQAVQALDSRDGADLLVTTSPAGARVFLDGRPVGASPTLRQNAIDGPHLIRAEIDGRPAMIERTVLVAGSITHVHLAVPERPSTRDVTHGLDVQRPIHEVFESAIAIGESRSANYLVAAGLVRAAVEGEPARLQTIVIDLARRELIGADLEPVPSAESQVISNAGVVIGKDLLGRPPVAATGSDLLLWDVRPGSANKDTSGAAWHVVGSGEPGLQSGQTDRIAAAVRKGIESSGARAVGAARAKRINAAIGRPPFPCDETCEGKIRKAAAPDRVAVAHIQASPTHFTLRVSAGGRMSAASGLLDDLVDAAMRLGNRLASSKGSLSIEGGGDDERYLGASRLSSETDAGIPLESGPYVVRIGQGLSPGAMVLVDVPPGESLRVPFPEDATGTSASSTGRFVPRDGGSPAGASASIPGGSASWMARGNWLNSFRRRALTGADGGGYATDFAGSGVGFSAELAGTALAASVDVGWIDYGLSRATIDLRDGSSTAVHGGRTILGSGEVGYRHHFGAASLAALAGAGWEQHDARDVSESSGPTHLFTSHQLWSVETAVEARYRLEPIRLGARLGLSPWSHWQDRPTGANGGSPRVDPTPSWSLHADWTFLPRWQLLAGYEGTTRTIHYSGTATAPVDPPLRNATIREDLHLFTLSLAREL